MTQDEFDSLAIFVAVVEELRREPFFSEDNQEHFSGDNRAVFCHPMFLKSAVLPFRKIWMSSERCAFQKEKGDGIRELVYREHPDKNILHGHHYWFYEHFDTQFSRPAGFGVKESTQDIIDLWLNTQLAHTGPMNFPNPTKKKQFSLVDFNACGTKIGREKFEFLFRAGIAIVGNFYISFEEILAFPLFKKLRDEQGMKPSFEADVALKYTPYSDSRYNIHFDDVFWHLSHEKVEESFIRLLARQRFSGLGHLLRSLFCKVDEAIDCVHKCETLNALLNETKTVILTENPEPEAVFKGRFNANSFPEFGLPQRIGSFDAFNNRKIRFYKAALGVLSDVYIEFRAAFKEARQRQQQPEKW